MGTRRAQNRESALARGNFMNGNMRAYRGIIAAAGENKGFGTSLFYGQQIGVALAGLSKFDNSLGDDSVGEIVFMPKRYARLFERDTQNPLGFRIDSEVV
jgi:hypothetical protein